MTQTAVPTARPEAGENARHLARPRQWDGRTSTGLGIYLYFLTFKWLGPRFAYLLLYPVVLYYQVSRRKAARASKDYLRRRFPGLKGLRLWGRRYRHFLSFGRVLVDRAYAFTNMLGEVELTRDGTEVIPKALDEGKGVILLSAHLGNWELAAYCLQEFHRNGKAVPVNAVMFKGESEKVERYLRRVSGEPPFKIIASNDSLQASIETIQALRRGEIVAIHGDRLLGSAGVKVPFLGGQAMFPTGPFAIAAITGAPLVITFANREGTRKYALCARGPYKIQFRSRATRDEDLRKWVHVYVRELEARLERYPLQWHNFYEFWEPESEG